jgi:uncharacterized membrane protein
MDYAFKIAIIAFGYIIVSIIGAYFIKSILRKYEKDVGISGLKGAGDRDN